MGGLPKKLYKGSRKRKNIHPNIIWLTIEEHYEAHKLLALENPDNKEILEAWNIMHHTRSGRSITKEEYVYLREHYSKNNSGSLAPFYGKHHSPEYVAELSKRAKGENNPMYGVSGDKHPRARKIIDCSTGIVYGSLREASRKLEIAPTRVYNCINKENRKLEGHELKYLEGGDN